jgi:hypothetical protein
MIDLGIRVVACCSNLDGEYYAGDQEYYCVNLEQQEQFEQGKYNMGNFLWSYSPFNYESCACVNLITIRTS